MLRGHGTIQSRRFRFVFGRNGHVTVDIMLREELVHSIVAADTHGLYFLLTPRIHVQRADKADVHLRKRLERSRANALPTPKPRCSPEQFKHSNVP